MKRAKRLTGVLLAVLMALTLIPQSVWAEEPESEVTVFFTLQKDGSFDGPARQEIAVYDGLAEEYGYSSPKTEPTLLDLLVAAHAEKYGDAFTAETAENYFSVTSEGWITKSFGVDGGDVCYYRNDGMAYSLFDPVTDGDSVVYCFYNDPDTYWYMDCYTFFDRDHVTVKEDESFTLNLKYYAYDANWNLVTDSVNGEEDAVVLFPLDEEGNLGEALDASFDAEGNVTLSFPQEGSYQLTAAGFLSTGAPIFMPYCRVTVTETETDNPDEPQKPDTPVTGDVTVDADTDYLTALNKTAAYILGNIRAEYGEEWYILGLARAGKLDEATAERYYASVEAHVKETGSAALGRTSTENSRVILALTAIGRNPADVAGYNLFEPLSNMNYIEKSGLNGPVFALLAFDSADYAVPNASEGVQTTREGLISAILDSQLPDGGFTFNLFEKNDERKDGAGSSVDMTAMAIQALAPYYQSDERAAEAIDAALAMLSALQNENGGYEYAGRMNSEACAQVVVALTSVGINPETDARFVKNGKSVMDALLAFSVSDGGFGHETDKEVNSYATQQGFYALAAYDRYLGGKTSLYDMRDVEIKAVNGTGAGENNQNSPATGDGSPVVIYVMLAFAAALTVQAVRKKAVR